MTNRRLTFSQRIGRAPLESPLQLEGMSKELRVGIWNVIHTLWEHEPNYDYLNECLIRDFLKWRLDEFPPGDSETYERIALEFFELDWWRVYDFVEFVAQTNVDLTEWHRDSLRHALENESSGFRLIEGSFVPITAPEEVGSLEDAITALSAHPYKNARGHLENAAGFLGDRTNPDYGKSIAESISAIEALCQVLTNNPKATLGEALATLEKRTVIHGSVKSAFSALYGYASDAPTIRHGKGFGDDRPDQADARYMLVTCSAFINYVVAKHAT